MVSVKDYVAIRADRRWYSPIARKVVEQDYKSIAGSGKVELAVLKEEEWQDGVARNQNQVKEAKIFAPINEDVLDGTEHARIANMLIQEEELLRDQLPKRRRKR